MKKQHFVLRAVTVFALFQAVSCTKTDLLKFKWDHYAASEGYVANCKLRSFTYEDKSWGDPGIYKCNFTYAPNGHPTSLIFETPIPGQPSNHFFYYDQKNRLIEYRNARTADNPMLAIWHRYGYNNKNQIIADTLFNPMMSEETGEISLNTRVISALTYDNQGRIIKQVENWLGSAGFTRTRTYAYDTRGNLVVDGWDASWYDDKVSFLRTHPVFTFISRNYSKNNPLKLPASMPARKYNSKKLPLSVNPLNTPFFDADYGLTSLTYDCK